MRSFSLALLSLVISISCKKDGLLFKGDLNKSYQTWLAFKDSSNNSYRYMVTFGSWTGYGTETLITVVNGKVTERSFTAKFLRHDGTNLIDSLITEWREDEAQLASHDQGAAPLTLDDIYKEARENWLRRRDDADTYFETGNNGKISVCGYIPRNCMDDCFRGIHIRLIEAL